MLVLYPLAWTYEATLSLPGYERLLAVAVDATAQALERLLTHPRVQNALAAAIAQGLNTFLRQPDLDQHVRVMAHTLSSVQPEIARKRGEELHNSVAMFIQGVLSPRGKQQQPVLSEVEVAAASSGGEDVDIVSMEGDMGGGASVSNKSKEDTTIDAED